MMPTVPTSSAAAAQSAGAQTCFCGRFWSATISSDGEQSTALTSTIIPLRMPQNRMRAHARNPDIDFCVRLCPPVLEALFLRRLRFLSGLAVLLFVSVKAMADTYYFVVPPHVSEKTGPSQLGQSPGSRITGLRSCSSPSSNRQSW